MRRRERVMGLIRIDVDVARPGRRPRWHTVSRALVDSGSEMMWLPTDVLRAAGVTLFKRDQSFIMANGEHIRRDVGIAILRAGDVKTLDEVVFALPSDLTLLGVLTLEGFNAIVDLRRRCLVAAGPMPAAAA